MEELKFLKDFAAAIDAELQDISMNSILKDIDEWSSFTIVTTIVMADEKYNKTISPQELRDCLSVHDIFMLISK